MRRLLAMALALIGLSGCERSQPYVKADGFWHFEKTSLGVPASEPLTILNRRFAKTRTQAFYRASPVEGADIAGFTALDEHYAKDGRQVWWFETWRDGKEYYTVVRTRQIPVEGADAASFRAMTYDYARDGRSIYYKGAVLPVVADPESFEVLDYPFARDKVRGYYAETPIEGSDGATFAVVDGHYAKDAGAVYWADIRAGEGDGVKVVAKAIAGADEVASFEGLDMGYARSATRVFHDGEVVEGADPASFATGMESDVDARDKTGGYKDGERVAAPQVTTPDLKK